MRVLTERDLDGHTYVHVRTVREIFVYNNLQVRIQVSVVTRRHADARALVYGNVFGKKSISACARVPCAC